MFEMKMNKWKSEVMVLTIKKIQQVNEYKCLGLTVCSRGNWINKLQTRIDSVIKVRVQLNISSTRMNSIMKQHLYYYEGGSISP